MCGRPAGAVNETGSAMSDRQASTSPQKHNKRVFTLSCVFVCLFILLLYDCILSYVYACKFQIK